MDSLICYKTLPEWDSTTLPQAFREQHNTKAGTWAKLTILSGRLQYNALDADGNVLSRTIFDQHSQIPFVEPQAWHSVSPMSDDLRCRLSFYCLPHEVYHKKYKLTAPHSEVVGLMDYSPTGKVLDLGCGRGRNALFLHSHGLDVTAVDFNTNAIDALRQIIHTEHLSHIRADVADINHFVCDTSYDTIISTVVLMFLAAEQIPHVLENMQKNTAPGGYNLIVSAMDTDDYPLSLDFLKFGFKQGELRNYYRDWTIKKYNEDVGHLHRVDAQGNRIALRFATLIAQKN